MGLRMCVVPGELGGMTDGVGVPCILGGSVCRCIEPGLRLWSCLVNDKWKIFILMHQLHLLQELEKIWRTQ